MFKVVFVAKMREPQDESKAFWADTLGPKGAAVPGTRSYVQSEVVGSIGAQGESESEVVFDGYGTHEFDDQAAFEQALASPEWQDILAVGPKAVDSDSMVDGGAVLEERIMRDGPKSPYKVVWFARFQSHLTLEQASKHWKDVHGPIALDAPGIDRYVQNLVIAKAGVDGVQEGRPWFHGFSECWYADRDAYIASQESEAWDRLYQDGFNFLDVEGLEGACAVLEERVLAG